MKSSRYDSHSEEDTKAFAKKLSKKVRAGDVICLFGELGSGKTTFVKGLAHGLKIKPQNVNSPTFVLMNVYEGQLPIFHFDLYRLNNDEELATVGYEEFLYGDGLSVIEWADRLGSFIPKDYLKIELRHKSQQERSIKISAKGQRYEHFIH